MHNHHINNHQKGVVLPLSLIFLALISLIAVTTISSGKHSESIASNTQQKTIAYDAAGSAVDEAWAVSTVTSTLQELSDSGADLLQPTVLAPISDQLSDELDQSNAFGATVDVSVEAAFQYCGETNKAIGSDLSANESGVQLVGLLFNTTGQATVTNSRAQSRHLQRGYIIRPASGQNANCPNK